MKLPGEILNSNLIQPFSSKTNVLSINQFEEIYSILDDIIDNLDDHAIKELAGGNSQDIEGVFDVLLDETAAVLASSDKLLDTTSFGYLETFSKSVEETFRTRSLNYFILACLPDFLLAPHNIEWGNLVQAFRLLNILAARDHGKCLGANELVLMYDGSHKKSYELGVGDLLMGPDSTPRRVLNISRGTGKLYRVNQSRGNSHIVNSKHTLSTYKKWCPSDAKSSQSRCAKLVDIDIEDYLSKSKDFRNLHKGYKVAVDFKERQILIDPYYLGLWLGDGTEKYPNTITSNDREIVQFLQTYSNNIDCSLSNSGIEYSIVNKQGKKNPIREMFRREKITSKRIPLKYMINSQEIRLKILAGLADSDGSLEDNQLIITQCEAHRDLINDIERLCYTLGLHCSKKDTISKFDGKSFPCIRLKICGEKLLDLPVLLGRKKIVDSGKSNSMFRRPKYYSDPEQGNYKYDIANVSTLSIEEAGEGEYISISVDRDSRFLLADNTVTHNSYFFSYAYCLWQLYRYKRWNPKDPARSKELFYAGEGMLVTNEYRLGTEFLEKIRNEIEANDILSEKLLPDSKRDGWGKEKIITKNGAKMYIRSANSKIRGLHPKWVVLDDFLNESSLYSQEQRDKYWNMFVAVISPALSPGGQMVVVGTPFFEFDLYGQLKKIWKESVASGADPEILKALFRTFEFPAIFPDGTILFPQRHDYNSIMAKKQLLGPLIFSREIMVKPITDDATIFPYSTLNKAIRGQEKTDVVTSLDALRKAFKLIVVGCDFAISANIGADYSVFTIVGVDELDRIHVLNCWRKRGKKFGEQIAVLKKINRDFKPDIFVVEINGMQEVFLQEMEQAGLPVVGDFTGNEKKSLYKGVPSLAILFEQERIKFPYGTDRAKKMTDTYFSELNSITFIQDKGKLESTTQHDDTAMSLWEAVKGVRRGISSFDFSFINS